MARENGSIAPAAPSLTTLKCVPMLACATDYDVWHESEDGVSVEMIVANLQRNAVTSQEVLRNLVPQLSYQRACGCAAALENAIITAPGHIDAKTRQRLGPIVGKYLG